MLTDLAAQWGFDTEVDDDGVTPVPMLRFTRVPYRPGIDSPAAGLMPTGERDVSCQ